MKRKILKWKKIMLIYSTEKFDYELFIQLEIKKPNFINTLKK